MARAAQGGAYAARGRVFMRVTIAAGQDVVTGATAAAGFLVADPLAAVAAALVTGITLYFLQGNPACAASSRR